MRNNNIKFFWLLIIANTLFAQSNLAERDVLGCLPYRVNISDVIEDALPSQIAGQRSTILRNIYIDERDEFYLTFSNGQVSCWSKWYIQDDVFIKRVRELFNCVFSEPETYHKWLDTLQTSREFIINRSGVIQSIAKDDVEITIVMRKPKYSVSIMRQSLRRIVY